MAFSHVATDILAHLTGKGREGYPEGLIHGDIGLRNIIFTPEGEATFIDFEKIRQGPLVYDVAYYIYYSCQSAEGEWHAPSISAALEAYESIRPLEPKEREALGSWITYIAGYIHFGMVYFAMNETTPSQVGGEEFMHLDKTAQRLQAVYAEPLKQVLEEYNRAAEQRQAQSAQP